MKSVVVLKLRGRSWHGRINLVVAAERSSVWLTIYNALDLTLVARNASRRSIHDWR